MLKNIIILLLVITLIGAGTYLVLNKNQSNSDLSMGVASPSVSPTFYPSQAPVATSTPAAAEDKMSLAGTVNGKLCYPSQFLPAGSIEAKNTVTNTVYTQNYPGSQNGGKSTYAFELPAGSYILRYKASTSNDNAMYGYHTETCPTGLETTCAATNPRVNIKVNVASGGAVSNVDLCDFYYDSNHTLSF